VFPRSIKETQKRITGRRKVLYEGWRELRAVRKRKGDGGEEELLLKQRRRGGGGRK